MAVMLDWTRKISAATLCAVVLTLAANASVLAAREHVKPIEVKPVDKEAQSGGASTITLADYKELINRNLFSKEQRRRRSDSSREAVDHETANELARTREREREAGNKGEADIVLTGIVDRDGVASAFLEDRKAGKTITAKPGDSLAGGKVGGISVNAMEFVAGEKTLKIAIGSNLQGGVSTAKPLDTSGGTAPSGDGKSAADAKGGAGGSDDANASIIEKLRRKRLKEMNK